MRRFLIIVLLIALLAACTPAPAPEPTQVETPPPLPPTQTPAPSATATTVQATATAPQPTEEPGSGSEDTNPLTGLEVSDPKLLDRRPMALKIENLPRGNRPQYGLTFADLVYEYYTELGTTRFNAIFYGQDSEQVGPIRSARWFDAHIIRMYKAIFAFGSAYDALLNYLTSSEFSKQLVLENRDNCPPLCRIEPNGRNFLMANTSLLTTYFARINGENERQDLSGMEFLEEAPSGGQPGEQVFVRFSNAIYNRWDYDAPSGRYLRWVDQQNASDAASEVYQQLVDKVNNRPIGAENVVIILVPHFYIVKNPEVEVLDAILSSTGTAYASRDGKIYKVLWERARPDSVLTLKYEDGTPFPFKPGVTWFEIMHSESKVENEDGIWHFRFSPPPAP